MREAGHTDVDGDILMGEKELIVHLGTVFHHVYSSALIIKNSCRSGLIPMLRMLNVIR